MASDLQFTPEEMAIDRNVGYPIAYKKLCRDKCSGPFDCGPPFTFTPSPMSQQETNRFQELDELFPVLDKQRKPTSKTKSFVRLLWKQLNHLGNAGFDPSLFRIDPYGNVLYYHADTASPLAWDIDHWFPLSRGGLTVASNLRILQWQVCQKKHNQLEFLIPWWDLQLGISINQFLSIFASVNSDFRHRAFSWLFSQGESEELNEYQTVDSHLFPQHFIESNEKIGLAPAAVVLSRRESHETSSVLRSLDINRKPRSSTPIIAAKKIRPNSKENEQPCSNPYQAIVLARDSLRQQEATTKMEAEIKRLDSEANELKQKAEDEKLAIQDLELVLIKRKRRAEKCRRLAEAQSSYRVMLEKMIRDAMHQSVVYKEQVRLNQAAANALMARLEAQKAICDTSERELYKKHIQRDDLEKQIRPEWEENARKRSRIDEILSIEEDDKTDTYYSRRNEPDDTTTHMKMKSIMNDSDDKKRVLYLEGSESKIRFHKELRKFLEEEHQRAIVASSSIKEEDEEQEPITGEKAEGEEDPYQEKLQRLKNIGDTGRIWNIRFPKTKEEGPQDEEDDDEEAKKRGKGNIEKWLQMLLDDDDIAKEDRTNDIVNAMNRVYPLHKQIKVSNVVQEDIVEVEEEPLSNQNESKKLEDAPINNDVVNAMNCVYPLHKQIKVSNVVQEDIVEVEEEPPSNQKESKKLGDAPINNPPPYRLKSVKTELDDHQGGTENRRKSNVDHQGGTENRRKSNVDHQGGTENRRKSNVEREQVEKVEKGKGIVRSESARMFRRIPSSPSLILSGMKKRVDCIRKKPLVIGDDEEEGDVGNQKHIAENIFTSTIKSIKKAVKI